ncbi:MAG: ammonium transporter [Leptospiraceae bacterium]|nr:ammonium transporter [Leptospiraceae bacterium]
MALCLLAPVIIAITSQVSDPLFAQDADTGAVEMAEQPAAPVEDEGVSVEMFTVNNVWMMVSTFLVFIMHLGFAMIESGLTQAKNTVNILFKNTMIIAIGLLTYALLGFNLMYPGDFNIIGDGILGFAGLGIGTDAAGITSAYSEGYTYWTDFLFQGMFAATAATIVSGAVAERVKLGSFIIFSVIYVAIAYPIIGSWKWGAGWLDAAGFQDFAGSTLVHSVGGWGALAGVILLGPRVGKYLPGGGIKPIMGHAMPLATIGMFLLWLGWFGFNGGSVLSADPGLVSYVLVTTSLAAASGIVGATVLATIITKKPDLSMALNGSLAGLVGITAGADAVGVGASVIIGILAGILVVISVMLLDKLKLDDPVGAISVHLTCGIWGTLATGIGWFRLDAEWILGAQFLGVISAAALAFPFALLLFFLLKVSLGIRVDRDEELKGLDIGEHGQEAYSGFQIFDVT